MQQYLKNHAKILIALAIVILLGLYLWWERPQELKGGIFLNKIIKRSSYYSLDVKKETEYSDIINLKIFGGFIPINHYDFIENLEDNSSKYPSKFVSLGNRHTYTEYMTKYGRMQFHLSWSNNDAYEWLEFIPSSLTVDSFFNKNIAIKFDIKKSEFEIIIPFKKNESYMRIYVEKQNIVKIHWGNN